MLGERDVHHARRLHVPGQSGAAAGALAGADIDRHARARHRLPGDPRRHQILEKLRQSIGLATGNLPRLLQQQTRAKSGEWTIRPSDPSVIHYLESSTHVMLKSLPEFQIHRESSEPYRANAMNVYSFPLTIPAVTGDPAAFTPSTFSRLRRLV